MDLQASFYLCSEMTHAWLPGLWRAFFSQPQALTYLPLVPTAWWRPGDPVFPRFFFFFFFFFFCIERNLAEVSLSIS